ncbi:MAG: DUF5916 domain-containing protein [Gemmatimonadota bacterium]
MAESPPAVDGDLDDPAWTAAPAATDFTQYAPEPGAPATQRTEARIVYDAEALYVAMRMYDTRPASIQGQVGRRDAALPRSDWAAVILDTRGTRLNAFEFRVTPAGSRRDVFHYQDTRTDDTWDAAWDVATARDAEGWTAEFRIPFSQLRYAAGEEGEVRWTVNFTREIGRSGEVSHWAPIDPDEQRFVSRFRRLEGLERLPSARGLETAPFLTARTTSLGDGGPSPLPAGRRSAVDVGLDLRYGLASDLTLTAAVRPDFGQVEQDPSQLNLTAYETFVPERRPFFREDRDLFDFPLVAGGGSSEYPDQLFYSRRVGRAPQGSPAPDEDLLDAPAAAPILAAAKLTGRTAGGWSMGLFGAATGAVDARVRTRAGEIEGRRIEPSARIALGRIERTLGRGRSTVGVLFTGLERSIGEPSLDFLHSSALAGGLDVRHRFAEDRYLVQAWLLGSRVAGSEGAIARTQRLPTRYMHRPDAEHLTYDPDRTSLAGAAGEVMLSRIQGKWIGLLMAGFFSPTVELNDLGFQRLADARYLVARWGYQRNRPGEHLRRWSSYVTVMEARTHGGEPFLRNVALHGTATGHSDRRVALTMTRSPSVFSTTALRGGPALRLDGSTSVSSTLRTDPRGAPNGEVELVASRDDGGRGHAVELRTMLRHQPTPRWALSLEPRYRLERTAAQWTGRAGSGGDARFTHGRLDQRTFATVFRVGYAVGPTLSLDLYAEAFAGSGTFTGFRHVANPAARAFDERFTVFDEVERDGGEVRLRYDVGVVLRIPDPDFNLRTLNSNLVLRWEYRPGSTLYAAWAQSRHAPGVTGRLDVGRDLDRLVRGPADHVFLLKATWWMGR